MNAQRSAEGQQGEAGMAGTLQPIELPPPRPDFGSSLAAALRARRSGRSFTHRALERQTLAELLWSAFGVNRPESGDRTAPSAMGARETELYAALPEGVWHYDALAHRLLPHLAADIRRETGEQDFVGTAPLELILVADGAKLEFDFPMDKNLTGSVDAGFIAENVYLYCAAEGLACVVRGAFDHQALARRLGLPASRFVTYVVSVGYPRP
jgi:SagB-type dehydrogenase family enzyme